MAVDTADKRASFFSHGGRYWMGKAYVPNGSIDAPHRLFSLTFYSGNALSGVVYTFDSGIRLYTEANWHKDFAVVFESTIRATVGTARSRLFDITAAAAVANSEVTTTSGSMVRLRSAALTLVDGNEYRLQTGKIAGDSGFILNGHTIWI